MRTRAPLRYAARPPFACLLVALVVGSRNSIWFVFLARSSILRVKADRVLCTVLCRRMPRSSGIGRTGNKHKRVRFASADEDEATQERRLAAVQAAAAAADAAATVAAGDDDAVREWLESVLQKVELQADAGELADELQRRRRNKFIGAGVACVEAVKSRTFEAPLSLRQRTILEPFIDAYEHNKMEWQFMYPADQCDKCGCHLALCKCRMPCSKCGQIKPRRAWRLLECYPFHDMCACEKNSNLMRAICR